MWLRDVNDVMHRKHGLRYEKKSVSWDWNLGEVRRICAQRAPHVMGEGADGKVSIERLCLSPYVEKPFNSEVIKHFFVPQLRSRKCFCVSGCLCYIWTFNEHYIYVSHIHVWVCYTNFREVPSSVDMLVFQNIMYTVHIFFTQYESTKRCYKCCILTSDPAKHAILKTVEVAYSVGVGDLGWQYGTELKSYCITVISARWWSKHAIPKTPEVAYSVGHLWKRLSERWTII